MFRAYAKINLGLRILERRADGYHNIETLFHRIDVFDEIEFSPSNAITVVSSNSAAPDGEANICYKAAQLLRQRLPVHEGVRIAITKRIPVGAGLGGGSADAATVLRHLPRFWNARIDEKTLAELALHLGSDVPFFLERGSALGKGRGEQLEYFNLALPHFILLCYPNIHVSTAWAYKSVHPGGRTSAKTLRDALLDGIDNPILLAAGVQNDFEPVVFAEYPEVLRVKETILRGGALFALMSGSGSSVFGLFQTGDAAATVKQTLSGKGYNVFVTPPNFSPPEQDAM